MTPFSRGSLGEVEALASHFVKSGYFKDARQVSQAVVKIIMGQALGIDAASSMSGLFLSAQGKLCMTANLMAATIKRSAKYDYKILTKTAELCEIEYFERVDGKLVSLGKEITRIEEFKHLTSEPWKKYPKNMLFARNVSNGAKFFTPDAFGGSPVYLPDELPNSGMTINGDTLEVETAEIIPPPASTSEDTGDSEWKEELEKRLTKEGLSIPWISDALGLELTSFDDLTEQQGQRLNNMLALRTTSNSRVLANAQ